MKYLIAVMVLTGTLLQAQERTEQRTVRMQPRANGSIPAWLVAGPFEQGIEGFGDWRALDAIGEATIRPRAGASIPAPLVAGGSTVWQPQSTDGRNYLDLNASLGWAIPGRTPEQVWWTKAGYAYVALESPAARELLLLAGTNSQLVVILNGTRLHEFSGQRDAVPDDDTIRLSLVAGVNHLLLKIGNSHKNHRSPFFGGITFGWGGYFRIVHADGSPATNVELVFEGVPSRPLMRMQSTIFFRKERNQLLQRHDLELFSPVIDSSAGLLTVTGKGRNERQILQPVRWGWNRLPLWFKAADASNPVECTLDIAGQRVAVHDTLRAEQRYELQLIFITHTDIGYTHPQPVVQELHCAALDEVLALCRKHPDFRWTIETVYQLQQFRESRSPAAVEELYRYIREGRIALSPVSTNPYTGWVSEEEMIRSMMPGEAIRKQLGITTPGAMYNDVPGLAWFMPRVFEDAGVKLLVCGLNEVYGGYTLQRSLPKAFLWEGGDGTRLPVYRTETYAEGTDYGLERDPSVIAHRMWDRLRRLRSAGEDRRLVLLNSAWFDNGPPAAHQFEAAKRWNTEYAYPRFVITTLADAAKAFLREYGESLPVRRGDWTSSWDMLFQGEPERVVLQRATQQQLIAAEALDAVTTSIRPDIAPATGAADHAYEALLEYSGHGSGLEAGFGTPGENALTMSIREYYLRDAATTATTIHARALTRIVRAEEAFESEGLLVVNPLAWRCTVPVEVELKDSSGRQFRLTDLVTGRVVPSYRSGHRLIFVAPDLPSMGFKKFESTTVPEGSLSPVRNDLLITASSIENVAYRIGFDERTGAITSLMDKRQQRELIKGGRVPFNGPLVQQGYLDQTFDPLSVNRIRIATSDQRPVRLVLSVIRPGEVVERTDYTLWSDVDRVDITHTVHLDSLRAPAEVEVYAAGFPFAFAGPVTPYFDILGGFLRGPRERLPGALQDIYSMRRSAALSDGQASVAVAAADSRILFWRNDSVTGEPMLSANLVTNFPLAWNRNEANTGRLRLRFAVRSTAGGFDPDMTARLGWEFQTDFFGRSTLIRRVPAEKSFLSVSGNSALLTGLKRGASPGEVVVRVTNVDPANPTKALLSLPFILPGKATMSTLYERPVKTLGASDTTLTVDLRPSETRTLLIQKKP